MISLRYAGAAAALFVRTNALFCSSSTYFSNGSPLGFQRQQQQQQQQRRRRRRPIFRGSSTSTGSGSSSASNNHSSNGKTIEAPCPLPFTELPYRGACLTLSPLEPSLSSSSSSELISLLNASIPILIEHQYNSCWVRIPTARSSLVASLTSELGFELHHVENKDDDGQGRSGGGGGTIVVKRWLREDVEDKVPPYPNTQVGCAGLVLSEDNELLLVKEWSGPRGNRTQSLRWKLPGGLLDPGESFAQASTREVLEETGVPCTYESLLTLWHRHNIPPHGISDIYVVCLLRPSKPSSSSPDPEEEGEKPVIRIDPEEISDCRWMKVEEFLATQDHPLITRILETAFGLEVRSGEGVEGEVERDEDYFAEVVRSVGGGKRLRPRAVMEEYGIRFGTRPVIPTYVGVSIVDSGVDEG